MIYRKWSLLTGPPAIAGGIVAVVAFINFTCVQNDSFLEFVHLKPFKTLNNHGEFYKEWLLKRLPGKQAGGSSNK